MKIRIMTFASLILMTTWATADIVTISEAYEVPRRNFTVPVTMNGDLSFKVCDDCNLITARMTPDTFFRVNGEHVELSEFRKSVFRIRHSDKTPIVVLHHLESNTIQSISVTI